MAQEWNETNYRHQLSICRRLTDKGLLIALNQEHAMTAEASEAYRDTLRERGWSDVMIDGTRRRGEATYVG